ncbi:MAG TPA: hypothetical protein VM261_00445 [Kofleriaceae bacterium]|nr:hypothetical protein [Kofleriaceae bacterium]
MYEVNSPQDLLDLQNHYLNATGKGFDGVFEVRFGASVTDVNWSLAPEHGKDLPAIDVVLKGDGAVVGVPAKIIARSVRIEGLVLTGTQPMSSELEVRAGVTIVDSAFIDLRGGAPASTQPFIALRSHGPKGKRVPATATIERTWFVRNWQNGSSVAGAALLGFDQHQQDGGFYSEVRIRDCVFAGNAFATEVRLAYAFDVAIERTVFYKTWSSGVLLENLLAEKVRVVDSVIVVEDLAHVASKAADVPAIEMSGTRIFARSYTPATEIPAAFTIDRGALADRARVDPAAAPFDQATKLPPGKPPAGLREQLLAALK